MIVIVWTVLTSLAVLAVVLMLVAAVVRKPVAGLYLISIPLVFLWEAPSSWPLGSIGGSQIFLLDGIAAVLLIATPFGLATADRPRQQAAWFILAGSFFVSLAAGVALIGGSTPLVEARQQFAFFGVLIWAVSVDWSRRSDDWLRWAQITGFALVGMAIYHASTTGVGGSNSFVDAIDGGQVGRILVSTQALALVYLSWLCAARGRGHLRWIFVTLGLATVVISQQRTVWAVAAVMALGLLLVAKRKLRAVAAACVVAVGTTIFALAGGLGSLSFLYESASDNGTYLARVFSWGQLISNAVAEGPATVLFGSPYGSGFVRVESNGQLATFNPHNWYITLFLRVGLLGVLAYLAAITIWLLRTVRNSADRWVIVGLLGIVTYGWTYNLPFIVAVFIGLLAPQREPSVEFSEVRNHHDSKRPGQVEKVAIIEARRW